MNAVNRRSSMIFFAFLSNKQTHTYSISCHCSFKCRRRRLRKKRRREKRAYTHIHNKRPERKKKKKKMNSSQLRDGGRIECRAHVCKQMTKRFVEKYTYIEIL
jgi:hypothetical protein